MNSTKRFTVISKSAKSSLLSLLGRKESDIEMIGSIIMIKEKVIIGSNHFNKGITLL